MNPHPIRDAPPSLYVPALLQPLLRAAQSGEDVAPIAMAIAKSFGFDGFWYGVSLSLQPSQETRIFVYSTWGEALTRLYDERAYIEIAKELGISERTVDLHFSQLRAKLSAATRQEAVGKAIDERIIRRGPMPDVLGEVLPPKRTARRLSAGNGPRSVPRSRH